MAFTASSELGGKLFDGRSGAAFDTPAYAGEICHVRVDYADDAPPCSCGGEGYLGGLSSGRGVVPAALRKAAPDPRAFEASLCCSKFGASQTQITNEDHIVHEALAADRWALSLIRDSIRPLARALWMCVSCAGVQRIILVGGVATALGDVYLDMLNEELRVVTDFGLEKAYIVAPRRSRPEHTD